ncbi:MAG: glycosyltransferase family 4 protein [Bacteroidota bacterium]
MHLLYIQQLLILPKMAGNTRSWEFTQYWHQKGTKVTLVTSSAALSSHPDFPSTTRYPFLWHYQGIDIWVVDVSYDHKMPFRRRILAFVSFMWKVKRLIHKLPQPDAVLAYTAPLSVAELGRQLARRWNCPFFLEVADVWPEVPIDMGIIRQPALIQWLRTRTRKIYEASQHIFTFSPDMKTLIQEEGINADRITTIFNGTKILKPVVNISSSRKDSSIVRLLYTGTLGVANDVGQLIRAVHLLEKEGRREIQLDIVGDGNDAQSVKNLAQQLDVRQVRFHQQVPRAALAAFWQQADIGMITFAAFPILESNAATKFFDYLAAGLPIIINYEGWQATYLREYRCGLSSRQGDIKALARNIRFLANNPALRRRMGAEGNKLAAQMFDRTQLAQSMLEQILEP